MGKLILAEVSRKQHYIFRSNKLKENVGASFIIREVTETLPMQLLTQYKEHSKPLLAGGGKSFFYFEEDQEGIQFIQDYSIHLLKSYPGLEMFFVSVDMDWNQDLLTDKIDKAYKRLGQKKSQRKYQTVQLSFGKEQLCSSTGLPAVERLKGDETRAISEEIQVKLNQINQSRTSKKDIFDIGIPAHELVSELDLIGESGEKNYIAIVHIDGNKMGTRFEELRQECEAYPKQNIEKFNAFYEAKMSYLSEAIDKAYKEAFKVMLQANKLIRPLILAGDDVCFVCHASDALPLSKLFLDALSKQKIECQPVLHGSAGIAIVKSHYPFMKGYQLAEELCSLCKNKILREQLKDCNMMDWHVVQGEVEESIATLRQKDYEHETFNLTFKPLVTDEVNGKRHDSYTNYCEIQFQLQALIQDREKGIPRSKVKKMREIYLQGMEQIKIFMQLYGIELSSKVENNPMSFAGSFPCQYGFYPVNDSYQEVKKPTATYYDAIEMMDFERGEA